MGLLKFHLLFVKYAGTIRVKKCIISYKIYKFGDLDIFLCFHFIVSKKLVGRIKKSIVNFRLFHYLLLHNALRVLI